MVASQCQWCCMEYINPEMITKWRDRGQERCHERRAKVYTKEAIDVSQGHIEYPLDEVFVKRFMKNYFKPILINGKERSLGEKLVAHWAANMWKDMRPIQRVSIPGLLTGQDFIGISATGTGKTLGFLVPMTFHAMVRVAEGTYEPSSEGRASPCGLVIAPTQELARQIGDEGIKIVRSVGLRLVVVHGGLGNKHEQREKLLNFPALVVATPGRLKDFVDEGAIVLSRVSFFALDEADELLNNNFQQDVEWCERSIPKNRQVAFFTATWNSRVERFGTGLLKNKIPPIRVEIEMKGNPFIWHWVHLVSNEREKYAWVRSMFIDRNMSTLAELPPLPIPFTNDNPAVLVDFKVMIFTNTRSSADWLCDKLRSDAPPHLRDRIDVIHGGTGSRREVVENFKSVTADDILIMIGTNVVGRGFDSKTKWVIQYDPPQKLDIAVHRAGRTARGGINRGMNVILWSEVDDSTSGNRAVMQRTEWADYMEECQRNQLRRIAASEALGLDTGEEGMCLFVGPPVDPRFRSGRGTRPAPRGTNRTFIREDRGRAPSRPRRNYSSEESVY